MNDKTKCWLCSNIYSMHKRQCPDCCATNANADMETAEEEVADPSKIAHTWRFVADWYGDADVVNGTADCSFRRCMVCGEEDHETPVSARDDHDYMEDRE